MKSLLFVILVVCTAVPGVAQGVAQDSSEQHAREYRYPEMIIAAPRMSMPMSRAPFSATVVERSAVNDAYRSVAADEPLKLVPGVKIDNQANGERVHMSIRGQGILTERGIRGIKIVLDGIPLNDPTGFAPDFFDVDFAAVDRIEVLRGAAASLYGGSASGGIMNLISQVPGGSPLGGSAEFTGGSNNFWKAFVQIGTSSEQLDYAVSLSRTMGDGYRQHTHFHGNNIYARGTYRPAEGIQISPILGYADVYHENPEGISLAYYDKDPTLPNDDAIPFNEFLHTERTTAGLKSSFALSQTFEIELLGFVKHTNFTEANNHTFNHRSMTTPGISAEADYSSGSASDALRNRVGIGTDLQWQIIDQHESPNDHATELAALLSQEQIKQGGTGIFLLDNLLLGSRWSLTGSLRYDNIHNELTDQLTADSTSASGNADFSRVTGRIGCMYSADPALNIFANWGEGFLPPATEELALNPDRYGGFNTHLASATSQGIEAGSRGEFPNGGAYEATVFYLSTENDFDRYRLPGRGQTTFYRNSGSTHRYGAELAGRYSPLRDIELQMAYTYSDFRYAGDSPTRIAMDDTSVVKYIKSGNFLPNTPRHQVYADLEYRPLPQLSIGMSIEALGETFIDGANIDAEAVKAYALLHAKASYHFQLGPMVGELSLNARNLAATKYVAFSEPDPGGNAYQPGPGREFIAGMKIHM
jgi:iron complex outermembrane receptor protein